jgi:hypothetical protein
VPERLGDAQQVFTLLGGGLGVGAADAVWRHVVGDADLAVFEYAVEDGLHVLAGEPVAPLVEEQRPFGAAVEVAVEPGQRRVVERDLRILRALADEPDPGAAGSRWMLVNVERQSPHRRASQWLA